MQASLVARLEPAVVENRPPSALYVFEHEKNPHIF